MFFRVQIYKVRMCYEALTPFYSPSVKNTFWKYGAEVARKEEKKSNFHAPIVPVKLKGWWGGKNTKVKVDPWVFMSEPEALTSKKSTSRKCFARGAGIKFSRAGRESLCSLEQPSGVRKTPVVSSQINTSTPLTVLKQTPTDCCWSSHSTGLKLLVYKSIMNRQPLWWTINRWGESAFLWVQLF